MKSFLGSLLSKKLLITLAGVAYFGLSGDVNQALFLLLGYLGVQGTLDVAKILKKV